MRHSSKPATIPSYDNIIKRIEVIEAIDNIANGIDIAPNQSNSAEASAGVRIKPGRSTLNWSSNPP